MDSLKGTLTPMKVLNGTLNGGIAYGTFNYNELENKPSINSRELVGNVNIPIPTKTSDLTNDSGFITDNDVPTKTSELTNDSGFITNADIPTKTSELTNDSGFITEEDIPEIPTKTSQLNNDSGFLTMNTTPVRSVNSQTGDVNLFIPNATSQLNNDSGFLTMNTTPVRSVNSQTGDVNLFIPNATSQLNNDSGFVSSDSNNPLFKLRKTEAITKTILANGWSYLLGSDLNIAVPGYTPIGISQLYCSNTNVVLTSYNCTYVSGSTAFGIARNLATTDQNVTFQITILFMRNDAF